MQANERSVATPKAAKASAQVKTASRAGTDSRAVASADPSVRRNTYGAKPPLSGSEEGRLDRDVRPRTAPNVRAHAHARAESPVPAASATVAPKPTLSSSPSKVPARSSARPGTAPLHKRAGSAVREGSGPRQSKEALECGDGMRQASRLKPPTPVDQLLNLGVYVTAILGCRSA